MRNNNCERGGLGDDIEVSHYKCERGGFGDDIEVCHYKCPRNSSSFHIYLT